MITIHDDIEQGTEAWHQWREGKYTGSNADKLLNSGADREYAKAKRSSFSGNFYTKRGHLLEPEAIELYEAITKRKVGRPGFVSNSDFSDCIYSPDGLCDDRTIEVKCFNETSHMKIYNGETPLKVLAQCHFGMLICDKKFCDLVIYNPSLDPKEAFKIITIKRDKNVDNNFKRILSQ